MSSSHPVHRCFVPRIPPVASCFDANEKGRFQGPPSNANGERRRTGRMKMDPSLLFRSRFQNPDRSVRQFDIPISRRANPFPKSGEGGEGFRRQMGSDPRTNGFNRPDPCIKVAHGMPHLLETIGNFRKLLPFLTRETDPFLKEAQMMLPRLIEKRSGGQSPPCNFSKRVKSFFSVRRQP